MKTCCGLMIVWSGNISLKKDFVFLDQTFYFCTNMYSLQMLIDIMFLFASGITIYLLINIHLTTLIQFLAYRNLLLLVWKWQYT